MFFLAVVPKKPSLKTFLYQDATTAEIGDSVLLMCDSNATSNVNYTLLKGGDVISNGSRSQVHMKSEQEFGEYECVITNRAGNASTKITIEEKKKCECLVAFWPLKLNNRFISYRDSAERCTGQRSAFLSKVRLRMSVMSCNALDISTGSSLWRNFYKLNFNTKLALLLKIIRVTL